MSSIKWGPIDKKKPVVLATLFQISHLNHLLAMLKKRGPFGQSLLVFELMNRGETQPSNFLLQCDNF